MTFRHVQLACQQSIALAMCLHLVNCDLISFNCAQSGGECGARRQCKGIWDRAYQDGRK